MVGGVRFVGLITRQRELKGDPGHHATVPVKQAPLFGRDECLRGGEPKDGTRSLPPQRPNKGRLGVTICRCKPFFGGFRGAAAVPRRMVPSSSDHPPRIRRRCRSRRGCRRRRRRPGAGAAGRGYARRLVIRTGGSGRCRLGVDRRVDRWPAARPRRVRRGSRGCGDRRSRSRRPGRGPWWDVSGGMDADGQRWSESGLDARRG